MNIVNNQETWRSLGDIFMQFSKIEVSAMYHQMNISFLVYLYDLLLLKIIGANLIPGSSFSAWCKEVPEYFRKFANC